MPCLIKFSDFSKDFPPESCGFDETTGEDTFCCTFADPSSVGVDQTQPPIFPIEGSNPRPCIDHTTHCARWAADHPESCNPGNLGYSFMREACQKSCERCGDKVKYRFSKRSDNFEKTFGILEFSQKMNELPYFLI